MINYNNHNITGITYNNHSIKYVYGCGGNLVWSGDTPTPPVFDGKLYIHQTYSGREYETIVPCDSTSALTNSEVRSGDVSYQYTDRAIVGDCVTTIYIRAFYDCNSLTSVTLSDSVTTLSDGAFEGCHILPSIDLKNVTTIEAGAFSGCWGLTSITIPDSVTSLGSAFGSCSGMTDVTVGSGVTEIPASCFSYCRSLTSITFTNSLTTIGTRAFFDCESLVNIEVPSSVTSIDDYAFYNCTKLSSFTIYATTPPTLGNDAFKKDTTILGYDLVIYVPAASLSAYQAAWTQYADKIQAIP
jgi:hypothetical protein